MLFEVVLHPSSISASGSPLVDRALRDMVFFHGILCGNNDDLAALATRLRSEWARSWSAWKELLLAVPHTGIRTPDARDSPAAALHPPAGTDRLLVATAGVASQLGVDGSQVEAEPVRVSDALEVVVPDRIFDSDIYSRRLSWSHELLPLTTDRDTIWRLRLLPLARAAQTVAVVDHYFVAGSWSGMYSSKRHADGPNWLLRQLGQGGGGSGAPSVEIYSGVPDDSGFDPVKYADQAWSLCRGGVREVSVYLSPGRSFSSLQHGRYLRFVSSRISRVVAIDHSLDAFTMRRLPQRIRFDYSVPVGDVQQYRDTESQLERAARGLGIVERRAR